MIFPAILFAAGSTPISKPVSAIIERLKRECVAELDGDSEPTVLSVDRPRESISIGCSTLFDGRTLILVKIDPKDGSDPQTSVLIQRK
jgi:hypothetical protein